MPYKERGGRCEQGEKVMLRRISELSVWGSTLGPQVSHGGSRSPRNPSKSTPLHTRQQFELFGWFGCKCAVENLRQLLLILPQSSQSSNIIPGVNRPQKRPSNCGETLVELEPPSLSPPSTSSGSCQRHFQMEDFQRGLHNFETRCLTVSPCQTIAVPATYRAKATLSSGSTYAVQFKWSYKVPYRSQNSGNSTRVQLSASHPKAPD